MRAPNEAVTALLRLDSLSSSPYLVVGMSCCCCGQLLADLYILGCRRRLTMPARLPAWHLAIWLAGCTSSVIASPVIPATTTTPPQGPKAPSLCRNQAGGVQALPLLGRRRPANKPSRMREDAHFAPFLFPTRRNQPGTAQHGRAMSPSWRGASTSRLLDSTWPEIPSPTYTRSNYRPVQASGNPSRSKSNIANA